MKIDARKIVMGVALCLSSGIFANQTDEEVYDPIEPVNRAIFSFNKTVDTYLLKPLAQGYRFVTPPPVQGMVRNFFSNLKDVSVMVNDGLQGKLGRSVSDLGRLVVNTTVGVGGLVDVASPLGLDKHDEDFGQTLAVWGYSNSSYLVLPFLGPSTLRDTLGYGVDMALMPSYYLKDDTTRYGLMAVNVLQKRADYISREKALAAAAVDEYATVRDFYLQRRAYQITDGQGDEATLDAGVASY